VPRCWRWSVVSRRPTCSRSQSSGGQLRVGQIGVQIAGDVEERLLEDVRGVEAGPDARVDAQLDHATEPITIAIEQGRQRPAVAAAELLDQVGCVAGRVLHDSPHTPYPRAERRSGQKK
jgi:hypothetical protein